MGPDFGGVRVLADFEFQIREGSANGPCQIFIDVSFVEADVVGAAERFVCEQSAAYRIGNVVDID